MEKIRDEQARPVTDRLAVIISEDRMEAWMETLPADEAEEGEGTPDLTVETMEALLEARGVVSGIDEQALHALAGPLISGKKVLVARGLPPVDGEDGYVHFFVRRDSEYEPEVDEEGVIDYKEMAFFQQVEEGALLCEVIKPTEGTDGWNVLGQPVQALAGRQPPSPQGKNTVFDEAQTRLTAEKSGLIHFVRDKVDVEDLLHIRSDVDHGTGNINFPGAVVVDGDVSYGFAVQSGGNIAVKGMVEGAYIEAAGDVQINRGINGTGGERIVAGGDLRSGYIENARLQVSGNITTDYIIDSEIDCEGDVNLTGRNGLIVGGSMRIKGQLSARQLGNDRDRHTVIEVVGTVIRDEAALASAEQALSDNQGNALKLIEMLNRFRGLELREGDARLEQLKALKQHLQFLKERIDEQTREIERLEAAGRVEFTGSLLCKNRLYRGTKVRFGSELLQFEGDYLERCRIYWSEGAIVLGTL